MNSMKRKIAATPKDGAKNQLCCPSGYIKKAAWHGMPIKWPSAYKALTRINFTTNMIAKLSIYVDIDKMNYSDAAKKWIEENQKSVDLWFGKNL